MFVDIKEAKSPLKVEVMLHPYKKGDTEITSDVCLGVLQSTNYARNIRDMLHCISVLDKEKQKEFKEIVLSTFDNREQPNDVVILGKKLAVSGGYDDELNKVINAKPYRGYLFSAVNFEQCKFVEYFDKKKDTLVERMVIGNADFSCLDLSSVKELCIYDIATLHYAKNLPRLDVSKCSYVNLDFCDLNGMPLKFADGTDVHMSGARNIPSDIDFSNCALVSLIGCDIEKLQLNFRDGAEVSLGGIKKFPKNLDVSMCSWVNLSGSNLEGVELHFRENSKVILGHAKNLPQNIDFSPCIDVQLKGCSFSDNTVLKFRNRKQYKKSNIQFPRRWKGQVVFADNEGYKSVIQKVFGR